MIEHAIAELPVSGKAGVVYKHPISFAKPRSFCRLMHRASACGEMSSIKPKSITITLADAQRVSGLLQVPRDPRACYVLAHSAGAGMTHPFMAAIAEGLAERGIATLRFQFLYMEQGSKRPDSPKLAHAAVRAAVLEAARRLPGIALFAGGKSFGGRMTSQTQAASSLPGVRGLVFLGFPLHLAGKPSNERAKHLFDVKIPMLFLQGTRDALADLPLLKPLCRKLGRRATLRLFPDADHSFHVPVRSGRKDAEVLVELLDAMADWMVKGTRQSSELRAESVPGGRTASFSAPLCG